MSPGVVAVGAFAFILAWGEYLFSITLSLNTGSRTASAGLHSLMGNYRVDYGLLTAASVVIVVPVIVLFTLFQRRIVEGLMSDSLKA
jgi:multiple sugar transport system permease protein